MKRTMLAAVLIAAMGTASFATGNGDNQSKMALVESNQAGKFNLIYADETPGTVEVKLYDAQGHLLRVDKIKNTQGFKRPYNLSNLDRGTYKMVVADGKGETSLQAQVKNIEEMAVNKLSSSRFQVIYKDGTNGQATVGIYNKEGKLIYSENVSFKNGFSKIYDLSQAISAGFTFEVSNSQHTKKVSF